MNQHETNPQVAFRAPRTLIKRLDRLGLALQKSEGIPARRSVVIRRAVLAGLPRLEDEALSLLTDELGRRADAGEAAERVPEPKSVAASTARKRA